MEKNKLNKPKSFLFQIVSLVILSIILIAFTIGYTNIQTHTKHIQHDIDKQKKQYLEKQKDIIYKQVHLVNSSIEFQKARIENKLKDSLQERMETALKVAHYIYDTHKHKYNKEELKKKIGNYLDAIEFNEGRGYYFTYDFKTKILISHKIKKFIGKDMTSFKDSKGINIAESNANSIRNKKFGFSNIYFNKPNDINSEYKKIICLTKFEPLNMIIGTGEYLDVVEAQIKKYVLNRFSNLKINKNNYLSIVDLHNIDGGKNFGTVILNSNKKDLVGKKIDDDRKDAKGKEFIKDILEGLRNNGKVYTKYWYKKPDDLEPKPKMSYFYLQKDWNWILSSGFYYDDLDKQIVYMEKSLTIYSNNIVKKILLGTSALSFIVILIAIFISIRIDQTIKDYTEQLIQSKDKEKKQEKLIIEQSKMVQMGEMIGNIAHQWRQPLSIISTSASGILISKEYGALTQEKENDMLKAIVDHTQYLSKTIDTFRDYIKEKKVFREVILQKRITNALDIIKASLDNHNIKFINNIDKCEPIQITMIVGELSQVIINIINNAKDVLVEKNINDSYIKVNLVKQNNKAILSIEDNGGGIPVDIIDKVFDPYFTTKHSNIGTGLGLYMSKDIIENSLKGKLFAHNSDVGAIFTIELPIK